MREFGRKHKLEFQDTKCKVMEIGNHKEKRAKWKFGEKEITNCESYKYLGEMITRNGKNKENLVQRCSKVKNAVRAVVSFANDQTMRSSQMRVVVKLHDAVTVPTLLYCSETWTLNKGEKDEIDKLEIWAWKKMIGLPKTTPNPAVIFATGAMYPSVRIEMRMLIYFHKILNRAQGHWARVILRTLCDLNIGWLKQIRGQTGPLCPVGGIKSGRRRLKGQLKR